MTNVKLDGTLTIRFWRYYGDLVGPSLGKRPEVYLADMPSAYGCYGPHPPGTFGDRHGKQDIFLCRRMFEGRDEWATAEREDRMKFLQDIYLHECVHAIHYRQAWHHYDKRTGGHCDDFAMLANYFGRLIGLPEAVEQDDIDGWPNILRPHGYYGTIIRRESVYS